IPGWTGFTGRSRPRWNGPPARRAIPGSRSRRSGAASGRRRAWSPPGFPRLFGAPFPDGASRASPSPGFVERSPPRVSWTLFATFTGWFRPAGSRLAPLGALGGDDDLQTAVGLPKRLLDLFGA